VAAPDFDTLTRDLCAIHTSIVDDGNHRLFERLNNELPLNVHRFRSGSELNGWVIPEAWAVKKATIKKNGALIYDGTQCNIGVAAYSRSFKGKIPLDELKRHLFTNPSLPDDEQMWHCYWLYKPWLKEWGMTPPKRIVNNLEEGEYEIDLETEFSPGEMLVADCHVAGENDATFIIQNHTCHPSMANDGFAAVAVAVRIMQWLRSRRNRYSYRLVLAPEIIGTVFYLAGMDEKQIRTFAGGVFAEMTGTSGPLKMGSSFWGNHYLDMVFDHVGTQYSKGFQRVPFRQLLGNDESVWESPGFEVPIIQINRCQKFGIPFVGYHSTLDVPGLMQHAQLNDSFEYLKRAIEVVETNCSAKRKFTGLVCLSNPKTNLYRPRTTTVFDSGPTDDLNRKWGYFQDCVVRYMEGQMSVLEMAERHGLPYFEVIEYLKKWEQKGLVELAPFDFGPRTTLQAAKVSPAFPQ
jgi:aminopeptidase-like protein